MKSERNLAQQTPQLIGSEILLQGWVDSKRDHGQLVFIDLRDRSGLVQIVGDKSFRSLKPESVIAVTGTVQKRAPATINPQLTTGTVEVKASSLKVISVSQPLPFPIDNPGHDIDEELRLKYRYLDLRRQRMTQNIRLKFQATQLARQFLANQDFVEIDTPILTKTTPEGARDFLVPSRFQPGNFYALPQSPQQYKQLLMVAGFERYFQFARCFRDEDPRADRAYGEFTQLDIEMSFITQEDIINLIEELFTQLVKTLFPHKHILQSPWPRIPHHQAMTRYNSDKPDLREHPDDPDELAFAWTIDFPLFIEQSSDDFFHGSGQANFAPSHHMFTAPHPDDIPLLDTNPLKVRGLQHDLVLNGKEVGGGSIRIHQPEVQSKVFDLIGFTEAQKLQFEHMLTAFSFGVPPHGGIAPGLDRFIYTALGEPSIREVIAFPTSSTGRTAVVDAPSPASPEQLAELGISLKPKIFTSVYQAILDLLTTKKIPYEHFEHEAVLTSKQAADIRQDITLHQGAKALVLRTKSAHALLVVPGDVRADLKSVRNTLHYSNTKLEAIDKLPDIVGLEAGAIPPFGSLLGLPTYVDSRLLDNQEIVFNAGRHDRSIKLKLHDFLQLEQPQIINHSDQ